MVGRLHPVGESNGYEAASVEGHRRPRVEEGAKAGSRIVPAKTIFVVIRGMILAKALTVAMAEVAMAFSQDMTAVIARTGIDPDYLLYSLASRRDTVAHQIGTSAYERRRLGSSSLEGLQILVPPRHEQRAIGYFLTKLHRRTELANHGSPYEGLFHSMLDALMSGTVRLSPRLIGKLSLRARAPQPKSQGKVDERIVQEAVRRIVEAVAPEAIILFGSAARGEMSRDSDLDFLVVKRRIDRGDAMRAIRDRLYRDRRGVGLPVDVIVVTPEDIERDRDTIGLIIRPALREGRVVYAA
jgi:predicted nucleotidyltransferase